MRAANGHVTRPRNAASLTDMHSLVSSRLQCSKIFKNTALANFHAEKSGHQSFSESTEEVGFLAERWLRMA